MKFKPLSNPIMIIGDNPSLYGGLSRIGRDLATLLCTLPQFRVAYLGRGTGNRRKFPFTLYSYPEQGGGWGENDLAPAWTDFSGGENGILFTTDDTSRRFWLTNTTGLPEETRRFLEGNSSFVKWGYFPVDSTGPNGSSLGSLDSHVVGHYERVIAASEWGRDVLVSSGRTDADWLPHGIWMDKFHIRPDAKSLIGWDPDKIYVGCVMANQQRKTYPAAFECFARLKATYGNRFRAWFHCDTLLRYWSVYALAADYGVSDCLEVSISATDEELSLRYSACDCTILPSGGEGFGYPIAESLACGTACVVTGYAGGQELVSEACRVRPSWLAVDSQYNCLRAIVSGQSFAVKAVEQIEKKRENGEYRAQELAESVAHLDWTKLKHIWIRTMLEGLR